MMSMTVKSLYASFRNSEYNSFKRDTDTVRLDSESSAHEYKFVI